MIGTVLFPNDFPVITLTHLCTNDFKICTYCRLGKSEIAKINVVHFGSKSAKIRNKAKKGQNYRVRCMPDYGKIFLVYMYSYY